MNLRLLTALIAASTLLQACDCSGKLVGTPPVMVLEPEAIDFGSVIAGGMVTRTVTAKNPGKVSVSAIALHFEGDTRGAFSSAATPFTIPAGGSVTLQVTYTARLTPGADTGGWLITSDSNAELRVGLDGKSVNACAAGTIECALACVDTQTDPHNCGACGIACDSCVAGRCACVKKTCTDLEGATSCGTISDGCGGTLDCGACPTDGGCVASTCGSRCGNVSDGCGNTLSCAACPVDAGVCVPSSCGARCGNVSDGCGNTLSCAACPVDAGVCVPVACNGRCGLVSDGCSATLDCGACPTDGGCVALTCQSALAACGSVSNGCGGTLSCGACTNGAACAGNQCVCAAGNTESCSDGIDNNCDGNVDCADPQCASQPACASQPCAITDPEVQVTTAANNAYTPAVLWTGTGYGLFYAEDVGTSGGMHYGFARLDNTLAVVTAPTPVTGSTVAHKPFPVWTGSVFAIGWSDVRGAALQYSNDVYFNRFSPTTGLAMNASDIGISTGPGLAFPGMTGWNSTAGEFGLLYADEGLGGTTGNQRRMYFQRVDSSGVKLGAAQKVSPAALTDGTGDYGHLVWGGSNWGAAWTETRNGVGPHIYFSRLTSSGAPQPVDTQVSAGASYGIFPRVASSGSSYGVVYTDGRGSPAQSDLYFERFDTIGAGASTPRAVTTSGKATYGDLVWTGSSWALIYDDSRGGYRRIYYAKLDVDGNKLGSEQLISCRPQTAMMPSVAFDGTKLTVAFSYQQGTVGQVWVKRFTP
jgi:hypothetical protein